jgi:protein-tyrosine phosphatase
LNTQRILNLEGGCNFRDLGGYRTRDGRELQCGRVFRTGVLSYFTPTDQERVNQLGVRVICDLRRSDEREYEPTRWPDANTQHLSWEDGSAPPAIRTVAANRSLPYTAAAASVAIAYAAFNGTTISTLGGALWDSSAICRAGRCKIKHTGCGTKRSGVSSTFKKARSLASTTRMPLRHLLFPAIAKREVS